MQKFFVVVDRFCATFVTNSLYWKDPWHKDSLEERSCAWAVVLSYLMLKGDQWSILYNCCFQEKTINMFIKSNVRSCSPLTWDVVVTCEYMFNCPLLGPNRRKIFQSLVPSPYLLRNATRIAALSVSIFKLPSHRDKMTSWRSASSFSKFYAMTRCLAIFKYIY